MNHGITIYFSDLYFDLVRRPNATNDSLLFFFSGGDSVNIKDDRILNKTIKSWHQVGKTVNINGQSVTDPFIPGSPNRGLFKSLLEFSTYPVYATEYGAIQHLNAGIIDLNLEIDHNVTTLDTLIDNPTNIEVAKHAYLNIAYGKTFNLVTPSDGSVNLIIQDSAYLRLESYSKLIVGSGNKLTLKNKS